MILLKDPRLCSGRFANADGGADASTPASTGSDGGGNWWQNSEMWSAIGSSFRGLTDMFGSIFSGAGNKQTDTVSNAGAAYIVPNQNAKKNNTWIWLVGVAVVAVVAVVLLRKFKK